MSYRQMWIWVEGADDATFVERVLKPLFEKAYDHVQVQEYAQLSPQKIKAFLKSLKSEGGDYLFLGDLHNEPCVTAKKEKMINKISCLTPTQIFVVAREIEAWYLAGLDDGNCRVLRIRHTRTTDLVTKEQFNHLIPRKFNSRLDFMLEILKRFSTDVAKRRNRSFGYFARKNGF